MSSAGSSASCSAGSAGGGGGRCLRLLPCLALFSLLFYFLRGLISGLLLGIAVVGGDGLPSGCRVCRVCSVCRVCLAGGSGGRCLRLLPCLALFPLLSHFLRELPTGLLLGIAVVETPTPSVRGATASLRTPRPLTPPSHDASPSEAAPLAPALLVCIRTHCVRVVLGFGNLAA